MSRTTCIEGPYLCRRKFRVTTGLFSAAWSPKVLSETIGIIAVSNTGARGLARSLLLKSVTLIVPPTQGTDVGTAEIQFRDPDQFNTLTHRVTTNSNRAVRITKVPGDKVAASRWHSAEDTDNIIVLSAPSNSILILDLEYSFSNHDTACTF